MAASVPPPLPPRRFTSRDEAFENFNEFREDTLSSEKSTKGVHFMVPFQRPGRLFGREAYIVGIDRILTTGTGHKRIALYGLGGIGKTRIALELAFQYQEFETTSVFWIHAGTTSQVDKAFDDIAKTVKLPGWDLKDPNIDRKEQVKDWLEANISLRWLLIIDGADDINILYGGHVGKAAETMTRLIDYFPRSPNGSIVLTTRNMKVGRSFVPQGASENVIKVDPWSPQESEQFLSSRISDQKPASKDIAVLAALLDHHPLALVQAASYMCAESVSLTRYLSIYEQNDDTKVRLLSEEFEDDTRYTNIKNPVAATFEVSFEYIDRHYPLSAKMLSAMSILDTKAIPESLFAWDNDSKSIADALGKLQAYSLITKRTDCFTCSGQETCLFDLQGLVRLALQAWLKNEDKLLDAIYYAAKSLSLQYPDSDREEWNTYQVYHPHALVFLQKKPNVPKMMGALLSNVETSLIDEINDLEGTLGLKVCWYLRQIGDYQSAEPIARRSLNMIETAHGPASPLTLNSLVNLAQVLEKRGEFEEAEKHYNQVLCLREQLSPNGAETLNTIHSLADIFKSKGNYSEAEEYFQRALDLAKRSANGHDLADTDSSKIHYDLGVLYDRQGRNEDAQAHFRTSYDIRKRQLGPQSLQTLRALQGLGLIYFRIGDSDSALKCLLIVLKGRRLSTQLGPDHPDTLRTHCLIASVYRQQMRWAKAEETLGPILEGMEAQLGKDHPHTLEARYELGLALKLQSKYQAAREHYQMTLRGRGTRLGPEHPQTLDTMYELGLVYERLGSYEIARRLCKHVVHYREKRHGQYDNHTLSSAQALAMVLESAGYYSEAEVLLLRVIDGWEENSRTRSVDFLRAHQQIVTVYTKQGQLDKASPFLEQLFSLKAIAKRRLETNYGLDSKHLFILASEHEYGQVCLLLGHLDEAVMHCKRALEGQAERLRLTNIDTLRTLQTLGAALEQLGRDDECEQFYACAIADRDNLEPDNIVIATLDHQLGALYGRKGLYQQAEQLLSRALQSRTRRLGEHHSDTLRSRKALAEVQHRLSQEDHLVTLPINLRQSGVQSLDV